MSRLIQICLSITYDELLNYIVRDVFRLFHKYIIGSFLNYIFISI